MSNNTAILEGLRGGVSWQLTRNWMFQNGFDELCCNLHPQTSCAHEVGLKFLLVAKRNNLLYLALHLIPFLLFRANTLRKKSKPQIYAALLKLVKRYVGSILFMSSFVTTFKAVLCLRDTVGGAIQKGTLFPIIPSFLAGSALCSLSLLFQEKSRRSEVALYAFVRAFPGIYKMMARRGYVNIPYVGEMLFVVLFGLLSLCYHKHKESLTYAGMFEKVWGDH